MLLLILCSFCKVIGFLDIEALALEGCHHPNLDLRLNSLPSSATSSPAYISLALLVRAAAFLISSAVLIDY